MDVIPSSRKLSDSRFNKHSFQDLGNPIGLVIFQPNKQNIIELTFFYRPAYLMPSLGTNNRLSVVPRHYGSNSFLIIIMIFVCRPIGVLFLPTWDRSSFYQIRQAVFSIRRPIG